MQRIVLAYSGSLDTSIAIPWLAEKYRAEVVTLTMDVGQGRELEDVRARALAIGAARAHVLDVRDEFARDFVLRALQSGASGRARFPLGPALTRPLVAKHLVEIAGVEGATAVAHGCSGADNDQARLEGAVRALDPSLQVIAPARLWKMSRAKQIDYARQRGIPVPVKIDAPFRAESNLWGRSLELSASEDAWAEPGEDLYLLTRAPAEAPDVPAYVELEFVRGVPVRINGVEMSLVELVQCLETIAGAHGIGRIDAVGDAQEPQDARQIGEAPAATALEAAHADLQRLVTPRELDRLIDDVAAAYAVLIDGGGWYSPARDAVDALVEKVQERVTGVVRLKFFKGDCRVVGRKTGSHPTVALPAPTGRSKRAELAPRA
jgi:argininosuccinate synthase